MKLPLLGILWEHVVLNELHAHLSRGPIRYWRTKHGSEVDFVIVRRGAPPAVVECKWSADEFDPSGMAAFRTKYPGGPNVVVASDVKRPFSRKRRDLRVDFVPLTMVADSLRVETAAAES